MRKKSQDARKKNPKKVQNPEADPLKEELEVKANLAETENPEANLVERESPEANLVETESPEANLEEKESPEVKAEEEIKAEKEEVDQEEDITRAAGHRETSELEIEEVTTITMKEEKKKD